MTSEYTVIDITSSKCRFRDTVDNPNVRILVFVETMFTSLKIVHVLWYGTVDVRNIWTAEAKLRFVIRCVSSPYLPRKGTATSLEFPHRKNLDPLSSHKLSLSPQLYIIWLHNTMSVYCSSNTSMPCLHPCLSNAAVSQLAAELRQFLVPCVNCYLSMPLPVGVWGTLLSGVGDARQLEWLGLNMRGQPVSIVWSLHIVGVSDVMTLNAGGGWSGVGPH